MTSKRQPRRRSLSPAKLDEMIEEATVDAYGESEQVTNPSLLTDVKRFEKASLAGEYYESFGVNSTALLSCHYSYGRDKMLAIARRTATTHQRKALAEVEGA